MKPLALAALFAILSTAARAEQKAPKRPDPSISISDYIKTLEPGDKLSKENAVLASIETARRLWGVQWELSSAQGKDGHWTVRLIEPARAPDVSGCIIVLDKWGVSSVTYKPGD